MAGYPCGCGGGNPDCGECNGTAPLQYQLTAPSGLFYDDGMFPGTGCDTNCEGFSGVWLLDYDPDLIPLAIDGAEGVCIWESEAFEECWAVIEVGGTPTQQFTEWKWRVELYDLIGSDGEMNAYLLLYESNGSSGLGLKYTWTATFTDNDCGTSLDMTYVSSSASPGCDLDTMAQPTIEPAP